MTSIIMNLLFYEIYSESKNGSERLHGRSFFARWPPYLSEKGAGLPEKIGGPCFVIASFSLWPYGHF